MVGRVRVSSRTLSHWYPRLATALEAGLGFEACLQTIAGPPASGLAALAAQLREGVGLDQALERGGAWLPTLDRHVIRAGALAGRLPEVLRRLAERHAAVVRTEVAVAFAAAYPVAVLHLGALAFPVHKLVDGSGLGAYAADVALVLVPLWVVGGAFLVAARAGTRMALTVLDGLPFVGAFRRARALADLAFVLEALLVAGVRVDLAWLHAGIAAGSRRLEPVAIAAAEAVQRGQGVAPVLAGRREIPHLFAEYYRTGEATGRLDASLQAVQRHFADTAATQLKIASVAYPALLFALVALWIAVRIVLFYAGYFRQLDEIMR